LVRSGRLTHRSVQNSHLHQFEIAEQKYSDPDFELEDEGVLDERRFRLNDLTLPKIQGFLTITISAATGDTTSKWKRLPWQMRSTRRGSAWVERAGVVRKYAARINRQLTAQGR
jgi:hypothetical protein